MERLLNFFLAVVCVLAALALWAPVVYPAEIGVDLETEIAIGEDIVADMAQAIVAGSLILSEKGCELPRWMAKADFRSRRNPKMQILFSCEKWRENRAANPK